MSSRSAQGLPVLGHLVTIKLLRYTSQRERELDSTRFPAIACCAFSRYFGKGVPNGTGNNRKQREVLSQTCGNTFVLLSKSAEVPRSTSTAQTFAFGRSRSSVFLTDSFHLLAPSRAVQISICTLELCSGALAAHTLPSCSGPRVLGPRTKLGELRNFLREAKGRQSRHSRFKHILLKTSPSCEAIQRLIELQLANHAARTPHAIRWPELELELKLKRTRSNTKSTPFRHRTEGSAPETRSKMD